MAVLLVQNFISVIIVSILSTTGIISTEPLTWRLIKVWFPVNMIFVGMLVTSMFRYYLFPLYGDLGIFLCWLHHMLDIFLEIKLKTFLLVVLQCFPIKMASILSFSGILSQFNFQLKSCLYIYFTFYKQLDWMSKNCLILFDPAFTDLLCCKTYVWDG